MPKNSPRSYDDEHIECALFRLTFNKNGNIKGLVDKRSGRALAGEYLNKLNVYRDKRLFYNAWDISVNYTKKKPAEFTPVADTYSKPLLIFGSLTQTISLTQQENALLQMDRAFIEQWNLWMAALDAEEKPEGNNDAG